MPNRTPVEMTRAYIYDAILNILHSCVQFTRVYVMISDWCVCAFNHEVLLQVPVHILSMCNINPEKSRQTGESQRSGGCIFTSHLLPWLLYGILMVKAIL